MCEILLKATPGISQDDTIHLQQGDIIHIAEDGHIWGTEEGLPKFWIIKIPTLAASAVQNYLTPKLTGLMSPLNVPIIDKLKQYTLDMAKVPQNILDQLNTTGTITVAKSNINYIKQYILNKTTMTYEA